MGFTNLFRSTPFAPALAALPITCFDVGSRGGIDADLLPIAFAVDAVGFEPDPVEFARLERAAQDAGPWRSLRYLPAALAGGGGKRALFVPTDPQSASLLRPDAEIGARFEKPQFCTVERTLDVATMGLDEAADSLGVAAPDYLKIDVEGAEMEVFDAGSRALDGALAVKTEVSFLALRHGQPLAHDIDRFLRRRGFELIDLVGPARWRRHGYIIHPQVTHEPVPYSRGRLVHGDYLYFRDPATIGGDNDAAPRRLFQAAAIAMAQGYFDHAGEVMARPDVREYLADAHGIDAAAALRRASLVFGRAAWRRALLRHLRLVSPFLRHAGDALLQR